MKIKFLGAVESVTGSCHLIEVNDKKILLDCGQFQGKKEIEQLNYKDFEFAPGDIDYLLLSHAHIDHSGRIPLLVKKGFKGKIFCSKPTYDLCEIMLRDSGHIHEVEAEWKNRKAERAGREKVEPLYTESDAEESFKYFEPLLYEQLTEIDENLTVRFNDAGHILGSAIIEIWIKEGEETTKLVFSGDLGMKDKPILKDPTIIEKADYLIIESTYGNRLHEKIGERIDILANIILKTVRRGGTVVIPSFAVGRTQEIIYELNQYYDGNKKIQSELAQIPVYIDSPLATKATEVFKKNAHVFDEEAREYIMIGDNPLEFENLHFTQSAEESKALNTSDEPKIIISASGMCDAGRIKHHLKHNLWKKKSSVIFVGYQAEGTLGRRIRDGEKAVKIFGEEIQINAEIYSVEGFSGHADKNGLLDWLSGFKEGPKQVFIVHGEDDSKKEFALEINNKLGLDCVIPLPGKEYDLISENFSENQVTAKEDKNINIEKDKKVDGKCLQPASKEKIDELLNEIVKLKELFQDSLLLTEESLNNNINVEDFNIINNKILEIEKNIVNLTMLSGK